MERAVRVTALTGAVTGKGNYRHFMEKELHEHPAVLGDTLRQYLDPKTLEVRLPRLPFDPARVPRLTITACGSAFLAGLVGRYWIEKLARLPVDADVASELRYRDPPLAEGGGAILVSQSGETADTMAALQLLREAGQRVLSVVNVPESSMARESDGALLTVAGPEIGVASTKAFTAQLAVLACLAIGFGRARRELSTLDEGRLTQALLEVPANAAAVLEQDAEIRALAAEVAKARDVLFLGRGPLYPIAHGRRAEAEGDQLHPRRGLRRRRDEARPDRADRLQRAGGRALPLRPAVREDGEQPAGSGGARRPHHGLHRLRRRAGAARASPNG